MPVVVRPELFEAWLAPQSTEGQVDEVIANAREDFEGYAVSTKVNNARNDFQELLEPLRAACQPAR